MQTIERSVTVGIGGATRAFAKGDTTEGLSSRDVGRLRRAGAFGDSSEALDGKSTDSTGAEVDLDSMKVAELRDYAKAKNLAVDTTANKADLLAAIKAADTKGSTAAEVLGEATRPAEVAQREADAAQGANVPEGEDSALVEERPESGEGVEEEGQEPA